MLKLPCIACNGLVLLLGALDATEVAAEPMDLRNPEARWIEARFEISPPERPGQTDAVYTRPFRAWLEPGERPGEVKISFDGRIVEEHLLPGQEPRRGSFSDFVWIFDAETGEVRSATVSGIVVRRLSLGFMTREVEALIQVRMDTRRRAGFRRRADLLGQAYHRFCIGDGPRPCTVVAPRPYDPSTGYVNAVGDVVAHSGPVRVQSFSPLGEAIFSELENPLDGGQPLRPLALR